MAALLEIQNLKKYFHVPAGTNHAVDDITMRIEKGKTMGVVGESGCGKSTLGRTIIRLQDPTGGRILLNGDDITNVTGHKLKKIREKMQIIFPGSVFLPESPHVHRGDRSGTAEGVSPLYQGGTGGEDRGTDGPGGYRGAPAPSLSP